MGCHTSHQEVSRFSPEEHLRNLFCMKGNGAHWEEKLNPGFGNQRNKRYQTLRDVSITLKR